MILVSGTGQGSIQEQMFRRIVSYCAWWKDFVDDQLKNFAMTFGVVVAWDVRFDDAWNESHDCGNNTRGLLSCELLFTNVQKVGSSDFICLQHVIHNEVQLLSGEGVVERAELFLEHF